MAAQFMSERLRAELQQRTYLTLAQMDPEADAGLGVPPMIQQYHSIYPLEDVASAEAVSNALGVSTLLLKGVSSLDGAAYTLRHIDPRQVPPSAELLGAAQDAVEAWAPLAAHPALLVLRGAFVSAELDAAPALFLLHDYHPAALSLEQAHIQPVASSAGTTRSLATEEQLWSYLVQLASALRTAHAAGLACRAASLHPSKVLVTSAGRVRAGSVGVLDVLGGPPASREELALLQREDLAAVGRLMLTLACAGGGAPSLEYMMAHFSMELARLTGALIASPEGRGLPNCQSLCASLGERVFAELDTAHLYSDAVTAELGKECENGRLLRLLVRLNFINERPEHDNDPRWAETGDRYLLKLFRDFVFHQASEEGAPQLGWGHAVEALNKLDAGVPEKILLLSRDEMSMLVVSYADVKRCLESTYRELKAQAQPPRLPHSRPHRQTVP